MTIARLAGPAGARSVVAESVLLKQQLLILNRTRKRAPNLRLTDRVVAGVCALLHSAEPADSFGDCLEACHVLAPASRAEDAEIPPAVLAHGTAEAGPAGAQPRRSGRRRRHETAQSDVGLSTHRAADRVGVRLPHQQGCRAAHSCREVQAAA